MKKLSVKISLKPITSMIFTALIAIVLTASVIYSTNLKNAFTTNGIYAVKGLHSIELRGDAELPLYKEALETLWSIPSDRALIIQTGFGRYIPGSKYCDLVYYGGVSKGDFYEATVQFAKIDHGVAHPDSLSGSAFSVTKPEKLGLHERKQLTTQAVGRINYVMYNRN